MTVAIIGDVHGCVREFEILLTRLEAANVDTIVSVGDLTDKGPESNACVELAADRKVVLVNSNHDDKYIQALKKGRHYSTIKHDERRKVFASLSQKAKDYLLTARPYYLGGYKGPNTFNEQYIAVHGGVGPNHNLFPIDGKSYNEILRLRYVDKDTFEKVATVHNADGSWGPEHPNVFKWQEVYDGRYGPVIHGHIVEKLGAPVYWYKGKKYEFIENGPSLHLTDSSMVLSIDSGCAYGGSLTAAVIDEYGYVTIHEVNALQRYTAEQTR